jgi:hypothetical protein
VHSENRVAPLHGDVVGVVRARLGQVDHRPFERIGVGTVGEIAIGSPPVRVRLG